MDNVIELPRNDQRDHIPLGVDIIAHPKTGGGHLIVVFVNQNLNVRDTRRFTAWSKALAYAAALSAKYSCPVVPHAAAEPYLDGII